MKRVLFVDDEPRILDGLRRMLKPQLPDWSLVFSPTGESALRELDAARFDVIVSDMRMPGMDGASLLSRVRESHPDVARVVLSGHTETESMLRSVSIAHQLLAKPCDAGLIRRVVERVFELQKLLPGEAVRRTVGEMRTLPSDPDIHTSFVQALGDPEISAAEVADIVQTDIGLCAKVLQIANSGFFGRPRTFASIPNAVARLGCNTLSSLAERPDVFRVYDPLTAPPGFSFEAERQHGLLTARIAASFFDEKDRAEEAFTAGILHDVGKVIIATRFPQEFAKVRRSRIGPDHPETAVETECLGFSHAEVGAYLIGLWGIPYALVGAVAFHHTPFRGERTTFGVPAAVRVADLLAREVVLDDDDSASVEDILDRCGLIERLPEWRRRARELAFTEGER